jgi:vacuolar-type H+-ATPase catalytic subunit A/Vma1
MCRRTSENHLIVVTFIFHLEIHFSQCFPSIQPVNKFEKMNKNLNEIFNQNKTKNHMNNRTSANDDRSHFKHCLHILDKNMIQSWHRTSLQ